MLVFRKLLSCSGCFWTFRETRVSRVGAEADSFFWDKIPWRLAMVTDCVWPKSKGNKLLRDFGNYLPIDTAPYPTRLNSTIYLSFSFLILQALELYAQAPLF